MTPMKSISFDAESMRQILAGTKGQTRRLVKWTPLTDGLRVADVTHFEEREQGWAGYNARPVLTLTAQRVTEWIKPPYEPGAFYAKEPLTASRDGAYVEYRATGDMPVRDGDLVKWGWKVKSLPAMYCPRWASRLTIEVTSVRVERLTEISEADAIAEGMTTETLRGTPTSSTELDGSERHGSIAWSSASYAYSHRWNAINGDKPGCAWKDDPFVWVVSFRRAE